MGLAETANLAIRISLQGNARAGIRGLKGDLSGLSGSVGRVGRGFGQIGTGLARAGLLIGGAAVTGIGAAAKAAIDFEEAFAGVRKTVDEADLQAAGLSFESLAQTFRQMATEIPIAATEFARLGETAGALGIAADDIDDFTRTAALLGETTNLSADEAADALGRIGTILGFTGQDFEDFADVLVNLGNKGASTESEIIEITKRFAGVGRQAGLTVEEITALSSAISSLGAEPEAAGSALSRIFANVATEIANGTKKGQVFAKITGDSLDELRTRINKGDALGIVLETLEGISGLSRTEAASVLKALGITNVRDRDAILKMAQNLDVVKEQLDVAGASAGALGEEAQKRFDTVLSRLKLLKAAAIEDAITFGEGLAPAIGRAADKLRGLLLDPATKDQFRALGQDVGEFIDNIDWAKVLQSARDFVGVLKGAAEFALALLGAIEKLPAELKAAGLGFLALNKLSGGLLASGVGNVVGGLAGAAGVGLASRAPGVGRLFAQPVFVTNWPIGGLGAGAAGAAGAKGGGVVGLISKVFIVGAAAEFASLFENEATQAGINLRKQLFPDLPTITPADLEWPFGPKNTPTILPELFGGNGLLGGTPRETGPIPVKPVGMSPDERQEAADQQRKLDGLDMRLDAVRSRLSDVQTAANRTTTKVENVKGAVDWSRIQTSAKIGANTATGHSDALMLANTIRANRTVVNIAFSSTTVRRVSGSTVDWRYRDRKYVPI